MRIKCIIVSLILFILSLPVCAAENIICDEFSFFRSGTAITSSQSGNINFSVKLSGAGKARLVIYYTDKDKDNLRRLNDYELSHRLYDAFYMMDHGEGEIKERGRSMVNACYEEFERRGYTGMVQRRV